MDKFRILITGSRAWSRPDEIYHQIQEVMIEKGPDKHYVIVHGGAMGADLMAEHCAAIMANVGWNVEVEEHPADWNLGKSAGLQRNQHMVDLGADVCLAFIRQGSPGATHCMTAAQAAHIPVRLFTE